MQHPDQSAVLWNRCIVVMFSVFVPTHYAGSTINKRKETRCRSSWKGSAHAPSYDA